MEWLGYSAAAFDVGLKRGAPVLRFASPTLQEDKTLVCFLVWSNPTNLCWASPALQADAEVVGAAMASPFYAELPPPVPPNCVLCYADETIRADKDTVLAALALSGYEFKFASEALRADAYVAAWAGAPVGSFSSRGLSKTFMRMLKAGVTVEHVDAGLRLMLQDNDIMSLRAGDQPLSFILKNWPSVRNNPTYDYAAHIKGCLEARCPLCLRVAPAARELLWPTREEWDGVF